jgi:predicted RNA binding protein YcfA (HicA-like mRNA interferase family)
VPQKEGGSRKRHEFSLAYTAYMLYYRNVTGRELIKLLKADSWEFDRIRGSYHIMKKGKKRFLCRFTAQKISPKER